MKDILTARAQRAIEKYEKILHTIESLPDLDGLGIGSCVVTDDRIALFAPFDLAMLRRIRSRLGRGWRLSYSWLDEDDGVRTITYRNLNNGGNVSVYLEPHVEGATCRRVQVGERTVPIYDVRCEQ